ncbi:MAG: hypothetical protein Q9225_000176 [Loekoesia sp. 1 TL-2023]
MAVHYMIYLFLSYLIQLHVLCYASTRGGNYTFEQSYPDFDWVDYNGTGTIGWEPLTGYVTPGANITDRIRRDNSSALVGDIVVNDASFIPYPDSAVLQATMFPGPSDDQFIRFIFNKSVDHIQGSWGYMDRNQPSLGHMYMKQPVPDPQSVLKDLAQDSFLAGVPTNLRSESADVFYFGPEPTNTACLSAITSPPPSPTPPQVTMDPSSVYVVYHSPQVFDGCRSWMGGVVGPPVTMSYRTDALSTLNYQSNSPPATKTFNFADLPCPPSGVAEAYDSGAPYSPVLVSPFGVRFNVFAADTGPLQEIDDCGVAVVVDPPVRAVRVGKITGPKDEGGQIP